MGLKQVVVISNEYGTAIYKDEGITVIEFDLHQWTDEIPDQYELDRIKKDIDKIMIPCAKEHMMEWYEENSTWLREVEEANLLHEAETAKWEEEKAKTLLEERGYNISGPQ